MIKPFACWEIFHKILSSAVFFSKFTYSKNSFSNTTPTKWSDAQPLIEREKQFECCPVEISRS